MGRGHTCQEISAKTTCNVLLKIFTQTGFPKMICSDQGTNFTSKLSEMFLSVMGVSPRFSTPGHPEMEKYLEDLIEKLRKAHEIAAETAEATQNNYASYYNLRSRKSNSSKSGTSWLDLRSRLRFRDLHYAPTDMAVSSMGDVTDHISSDCQELDDVQRLELLNT
ncbi:retrovirus-related Pol polyprotein from transposon opus [Trichonephila clavipes]|nr:retrovirus-related Pol polyprotein from transposon opus [Trichonephila clavipes]